MSEEHVQERSWLDRHQFRTMWTMCLISLSVVGFLRFYLMPQEMFPQMGEECPTGFIPLVDPELPLGGFCEWRLGTYFRVMHNLTAPPLICAYVLTLGLLQCRWSSREPGRQPPSAMPAVISILFALFAIAYVLSAFTPVRVFGVRFATT
jgi:hypothetical protein